MTDEAAITGGRGHFLDHGVDVAHFSSPGEVPPDVASIAHPTIGFFGGFDDYVIDFGLLEKVANEMPEAHLLLIGDATCSMDRLTRHQNVTWLGAREYRDIPAYGRAFDVAIMPWLQNDWIQNCNPIKLKEYLVLGLPVVSTYFPEVDRFTDRVDVAADADEFVALVRKALENPHAPRPPGDVRGWAWSERAAELLALIDSPVAEAGR
jgi:glycosyltransferase involved in cell wall biosynthesis